MKNNKIKYKILLPIITPLILTGCFLMYIPILMLAPLQPFIMIIAKVAARYGPLLLLLVETNQQLPYQQHEMIAMQPAAITENTKLNDLEKQLIYEAKNNKNVHSVIVAESKNITVEWLARQIRNANKNNLTIRAIFVNSKNYSNGKKLNNATLSLLKNKKIQLCVTKGLAEKIVPKNFAVKRIYFEPEVEIPTSERAAYACLLSTVPANF